MTLQIVGSIISMLIVMYLCFRGVSPLLAAPVAVIGISLSCGLNLTESLFTTFAAGIGSQITSLILYFVVSCMFAELMQRTGSADSIANFLAKHIGAKHAPVCIILICGILSMGGLGLGAMIIAFSIGQTLCKRANYSRNIIYGCIYAGTMFCCLPFIASANNMVGVTYFGGTPSSGWALGLINGIFLFVCSAVILELWVRRWQKNGEGYEEVEGVGVTIREEKDCPNIIVAILPICVSVILYSAVGWHIAVCVFIGSLLCIAMSVKQFKAKEWYDISLKGLVNGVVPTMNFAFMGAIGTVISATPMYNALIEYLGQSSMNPYMLTAISTNVIAFFIGAVVPTYNVVGASMAPVLTQLCMSQGLSIANLQRIFVLSPCIFDSLPSSGGINSLCAMFKVPMRKTYPPIFVVGVVLTAIAVFGVSVPLAGILPG